MAEISPAAQSNLRFMIRALRYRNYRLFFGGQIVSLVGTWLTTVATSWLVYRLSPPADAALYLGVVNFAGQVPVFLMSPFAGVWVDRLNRHRILVATQTLAMVQSFILAYLALRGVITIWQVVVLQVFQGLVNALDIPTRQAFVVEMIENREDLSNAIALNSSMVHAARLVGPGIAGLLIAGVGEGICFLIDGFSYFAVIIALVAMRLQQTDAVTAHRSAMRSLREGFSYAYRFAPIRAILTLVAVTSLVTMSQSVLMPLFADRVLGGRAATLGLLLGASGLGALVGSLYLASRRSVVGLGRIIYAACGLLGVGLIGFAASHWLALSIPLLMVSGFAMVVEMASANTVLQTIVDEDKRGRVMSLFTMAFLGMAPFGSLLSGAIANAIGPQWTLVGSGAACLLTAAWFGRKLPSLRVLIRPIYRQKGILPEVAEGIQSVAGMTPNAPE